VQAEVDRRAQGSSLGGLSDGDLAEALKEILVDDSPRPGPAGTRFADPETPAASIEFNRGLERLISDATLANLPTLGDDELRTSISQLRQLEHEVSERRTALHGVMDTLARDLAQRLAVGT